MFQESLFNLKERLAEKTSKQWGGRDAQRPLVTPRDRRPLPFIDLAGHREDYQYGRSGARRKTRGTHQFGLQTMPAVDKARDAVESHQQSQDLGSPTPSQRHASREVSMQAPTPGGFADRLDEPYAGSPVPNQGFARFPDTNVGSSHHTDSGSQAASRSEDTLFTDDIEDLVEEPESESIEVDQGRDHESDKMETDDDVSGPAADDVESGPQDVQNDCQPRAASGSGFFVSPYNSEDDRDDGLHNAESGRGDQEQQHQDEQRSARGTLSRPTLNAPATHHSLRRQRSESALSASPPPELRPPPRQRPRTALSAMNEGRQIFKNMYRFVRDLGYGEQQIASQAIEEHNQRLRIMENHLRQLSEHERDTNSPRNLRRQREWDHAFSNYDNARRNNGQTGGECP